MVVWVTVVYVVFGWGKSYCQHSDQCMTSISVS